MLSIANRNTIDSKRGGLTGLNKIFASYGVLHMWSGENATISGTTTTWHDYGGSYDLVNDTALAQPTTIVENALYNNKPTILLDGINDRLINSVANFRGSDSSGHILTVGHNAGGTIFTNQFTIYSSVANNRTYQVSRTSLFNPVLKGVFGSNDLRGTQTYSTTPKVASYASNGTSYKLVVDAIEDTSFTVVGGSNDGSWMGDTGTTESIGIGYFNSAPGDTYGATTVALVLYVPFTDVSTMLALQNELKNYYGI